MRHLCTPRPPLVTPRRRGSCDGLCTCEAPVWIPASAGMTPGGEQVAQSACPTCAFLRNRRAFTSMPRYITAASASGPM